MTQQPKTDPLDLARDYLNLAGRGLDRDNLTNEQALEISRTAALVAIADRIGNVDGAVRLIFKHLAETLGLEALSALPGKLDDLTEAVSRID